MILTLISPSGERWAFKFAAVRPATVALVLGVWVGKTFPQEQEIVSSVIRPLLHQKVPKGKALLNHQVTSGWQAMLANP